MNKMDNRRADNSQAIGVLEKSLEIGFIIIKFAATVTYATFKIVFKTMAALSIIGGFNDNQHRR